MSWSMVSDPGEGSVIAWAAGRAAQGLRAQDARRCRHCGELPEDCPCYGPRPRVQVHHLADTPEGVWLRLYEVGDCAACHLCDVCLCLDDDGAPCFADTPGAHTWGEAMTAHPAGVALEGFAKGASYIPMMIAALAEAQPEPAPYQRQTWGDIQW